MKTEMDVLRMDERQRRCWLLANRATLFLVGICWMGIIGWRLYQGEVPYFLIVMVPVFALSRFVFYQVYKNSGSSL